VLYLEYLGCPIFERDIKTIGKHINNALKEGLDDVSSSVAKIATVQKEGVRAVTRNIDYSTFCGLNRTTWNR
jgi:hypothetical protein